MEGEGETCCTVASGRQAGGEGETCCAVASKRQAGGEGETGCAVASKRQAGGEGESANAAGVSLQSSGWWVSRSWGEPQRVSPTSANTVNLSATIAAHELGHLSGLEHQDALGPIGGGIYNGVNPEAFYPAMPGVISGCTWIQLNGFAPAAWSA